MKFLKKLKSSNFWVSMISAVVLILQAVFNVDIKTEYLNQIILGILGVLVMTGIVTDSPSDEVTVSQTLDLDSVKESISTMFTQISATLQTDITNIVSQFEKLNSTQNESEIKNEVVQTEDAISTKIKNEEIDIGQVSIDAIIEEQIVDNKNNVELISIQQNLPQTNAPKNEL
ncbi:MAG: hypothetical protein IJ371_05940 [Clostridia bacterium]|nr:hypothetical protein [Clostridia bacterium]